VDPEGEDAHVYWHAGVAGGSRHLPARVRPRGQPGAPSQPVHVWVVVQPARTSHWYVQQGPGDVEPGGAWSGAELYFGDVLEPFDEDFYVTAFASPQQF